MTTPTERPMSEERQDWRPMADAPRDGTVIRVKERGPGDHEFDVVWSTAYSIHGLGGNWTPPNDMGNYGDMHLAGWRPTERQDVEGLLEPNGNAGDVEVKTGRDPRDGQPYPIPVCQYFAAQAGPYKEGTPVVVMSDAEAERVRAALRTLREQVDDMRQRWHSADYDRIQAEERCTALQDEVEGHATALLNTVVERDTLKARCWALQEEVEGSATALLNVTARADRADAEVERLMREREEWAGYEACAKCTRRADTLQREVEALRARWALEVSTLQEEMGRIEDLTAPERDEALDVETVVEVWEIARAAPSKAVRRVERLAARDLTTEGGES